MAINIQNLLDAIAAKSASNTPGTLSAGESDALVNLVTETSNLYDTFYQSDSATDYSTSQEGLVKTLYSLNTDSFYFTSGRGDWRKQTFLTPTVVNQSLLQGRTFGYFTYSSGVPTTNLAKYTFSSDAFVGGFSDTSGLGPTDGELWQNRSRAGKSETKGYLIGGQSPNNPGPTGSRIKAITSFPFASGVISREGSLIYSTEDHTTITDIKNGYVYSHGGQVGEPGRPNTGESYRFPVANPWVTVTQSVLSYGPPPFSPPTNIGNPFGHVGISSETTGYIAGGRNGVISPVFTNQTEKRSFPYASVTPTSEMVADGSLFQGKTFAVGISAPADGYVVGGYQGPGTTNLPTVQKWPFATPGSVTTDAGDLSPGTFKGAGMFTETDGYLIGGTTGVSILAVQKFPFATFTTASNVANISPLAPQAQEGTGTQL